MAYAIIEKSGCGIHKGRAKLRIDLFLNPDDPHYDKRYVYVPVIPEEGYQGKIGDDGSPVDIADFEAWIESLPHIWVNTPFHHHFIHPAKDATDADIKQQIDKTLTYFYQFHQACWDADKEFIDEWKKVPPRVGNVRCPFVKGDPKDFTANQAKVQDILSRVKDFQIGRKISRDFELPKGEGTIDVGFDATEALGAHYTGTKVEGSNPANDTGTIDTMQIWASLPIAGDVEGALFIDEGSNVLSTRDNEVLGSCSTGDNEFTGLSIDVETGDYIGAYIPDSALSGVSSGGSGVWSQTGDHIPCSSETFTLLANYRNAIYGTGTEAAAAAELGAFTQIHNPFGLNILTAGQVRSG